MGFGVLSHSHENGQVLSPDIHIFSGNLLSSPRRHQEGFDKLPKQGAQACLSSCPCSQGPSASPAYIVNHQADCTSMTLHCFITFISYLSVGLIEVIIPGHKHMCRGATAEEWLQAELG